MSRALVIGFGSIGARHARVLGGLGCAVAVVSQRDVAFAQVFHDLDRALGEHRPDYVVVANATDRHHASLRTLALSGFAGTVLVEKPLFHRLLDLPAHRFACSAVAYNLRFHPVIASLQALLRHESILTVQVYTGQYLPQWRPGTDYRTGYSADASRGGGVLRDLSHELDYLLWFLGPAQRVAALGGHFSPLEITSDDAFALLFGTERCPMVSVQLNYLDRTTKRRVVVNTADHTFDADLVAGTLACDGVVTTFETDRDTTYVAMHKALLTGSVDVACSLADGLASLRLIEAATLAAQRKEWVTP